MPSLTDQIFDLSKTLANSLVNLQQTGTVLADDTTATNRMNTCVGCSEFDPQYCRCKVCGCFMKLKVRLAATTCPLNKW